MKNYLVTGGAGFIGSNYIHYLLAGKAEVSVINLDNLDYSGNMENLRDLDGNENYTFIKGDICDEKLISHIFREKSIDYVVHFAAMTHVDRSIHNARPFVKTNVEGTLNLLENARIAWEADGVFPNDKKFLHVSTDEVYGDLGEGEYFMETTPLAPRNPYSASKAGAEMMAKAYWETHRLPVNITRCSNNYGPNQFPEKLIPLLIHNCINHKKLPIYGDGLSVRDWLYVRDHCAAVEAVLKRGVLGEVYNIGGHNEKTTLDIAAVIINHIREKYDKTVTTDLIEHIQDRKGHDRRYAIDPAKTNKELNWAPEVTFEEGIRMTIDWYLNHQEWLNDVVSGEYQHYYKQHYHTLTSAAQE